MVSPAHAGMDRSRGVRVRDVEGFPRTRGDGPGSGSSFSLSDWFPPRRRGRRATTQPTSDTAPRNASRRNDPPRLRRSVSRAGRGTARARRRQVGRTFGPGARRTVRSRRRGRSETRAAKPASAVLPSRGASSRRPRRRGRGRVRRARPPGAERFPAAGRRDRKGRRRIVGEPPVVVGEPRRPGAVFVSEPTTLSARKTVSSRVMRGALRARRPAENPPAAATRAPGARPAPCPSSTASALPI